MKIKRNQTSRALGNGYKRMKAVGFTLRDYQIKGVRWMIRNELTTTYRGGILADDPGLGKTIQTAALMIGVRKKTLIIVPKPVLTQWKNIMEKVFGESVYIHYGPEKAKTKEELMAKQFDVCITTHGSAVSRNREVFTTILHIPSFWERIVIDEGHLIRNHKTKVYQTMINFKDISESRWLLTGTPLQNKKKDILNLLTFVGPSHDILKEHLEFYITKYLLRRTKQETLIGGEGILRACNNLTKIIDFKTREEEDAYDEIENISMRQLADSKYSGASDGEFQILLLEVMMRLRQATTSPKLAIDSLRHKYGDSYITSTFDGNSTKLREVTHDLSQTEGLSLVFCHFHSEMEEIKNLLSRKGFESRLYSGKLSVKQRDQVLKDFLVEGGPTILIVQIMAGGVGLNLQNFSNVFILSPDWNPCNEIQAISRAHRYGQSKKVNVFKYIIGYNPEFTIGDDDITTIDERIIRKQIVKRDMMAGLLKDQTLKFKERVERMGIEVSINIEDIVAQYPL